MVELTSYIEQFKQQRIMVIGDIIADEFITGQPERLSREAPVIILRQQEREILPGGSANACNNIRSLGGEVIVVGLIGDDQAGNSLHNILKERGINTDGLIINKGRPTSLKTRVLAGSEEIVKQQVVRIDHLDRTPVKQEIEDKLKMIINSQIDSYDAVLISDYGNGLFSPGIKQEITRLGRLKNKFIALDSRYNLLDYKGVSIATPNLEEAGRAAGKKLRTQDDVIETGKKLIVKMGLDYLLVTQGGNGMTLFTADGDYTYLPAANFSEVYDVTGAGDTVVGTIVLAIGAGAKPIEAMKLANYAAGIVVQKSGVATVTPEELRLEVVKNEN